jgi:hypothetical protein
MGREGGWGKEDQCKRREGESRTKRIKGKKHWGINKVKGEGDVRDI